jgi:hypothetical protein
MEDVKEKFDLILEGHASLNKKIDTVYEKLDEKIEMNGLMIAALSKKIDDVDARLSKKIDDVETNLSTKLDGVAADLSAHRADTESHPKGYRVSE